MVYHTHKFSQSNWHHQFDPNQLPQFDPNQLPQFDQFNGGPPPFGPNGPFGPPPPRTATRVLSNISP